ncbi:unnamed protein product [Ilex paraguariensis]|uniref:LOB domain-containing protein n=1 Tax=Ilex paraguariensis TaxID=185542 RepID=A0ABC8SY46_9AQUA
MQRKKMSSSNSPCAACKLLRRKCAEDCIFAPCFPPNQPDKFASVHKVFGASNVGKLLGNYTPRNAKMPLIPLHMKPKLDFITRFMAL